MKKTQESFSELLTIHEVSKILKCTPATLRNWDREGLLKAIRIGKRGVRRYKYEDIRTILDQEKKIKKIKVSSNDEIVFAEFTDAMPDPVLITDTKGRIYYVNPAWEKTTGYTFEEVKGKNPRFLKSDQTPRHVHKTLWNNLLKGKTFTTSKVINRKKNGEEFPVHAVYFPIQKNGKNKFFVQIFHDITRIKEIERQKDIFIGIASHELKTPITTLFAYAQILEKRLSKQSDKQNIHLISNIIRETKRLIELIDDLLHVARLDSGKMEFKFEIFDLNTLIHQVVMDIQHTTEKHHIEIEGKIEQKVLADKNRIEQVIVNLLTNAIKYSPNADKIIVHLLNDKTKAIVAVEDFGLGIASYDLPHIFERFYRSKDKNKDKIKGFGLGLYIAREIIRKNKGKIWVKSKKNKGSTFYFSLPFAK
ncbi:MAG: hypothetical protein KatS3mg089_0337 [Patescibacteria group bacterium]|nr:MAG: hypothetical protein KatS3mg089_0337 [Patescibacteria group bacterium]